MKINIKATNFELTEAIKDYVNEKLLALNKLLPPHDESVMVDAEVGKVNRHHHNGEEMFKAEVNLHFRRNYLRAEVFNENLYAAIDEVQDDIARQINTSIEKRHTSVRRGHRAIKGMLRGAFRGAVRGASFWRRNNKE